MVAEALVGVEAAAWLRAWAGMSIEAKEGLLDNSGVKKKKKIQKSYQVMFSQSFSATDGPGWTVDRGHGTRQPPADIGLA